MKTITIPATKSDSERIEIIDYTNLLEVQKQKVILGKNTFSFLIEGYKKVHINNSYVNINNSEFLLIKSGNCIMSEKLSVSKQYRSILLLIPENYFLNFIQKNNIKISNSNQSVFKFEYDNFIKRYVESLMDISKLSINTKHKILEAKFEEIIIYLSEKYGYDFLISIVKKDNPAKKFTQIIETNTKNKLSLKELAFLCNMSVSTFKRTFEKTYNTSPIKYFTNKRLEYANYLLTVKNKQASEIYLEVGYQSLSNFIQAYKNKFGITPKKQQDELSST